MAIDNRHAVWDPCFTLILLRPRESKINLTGNETNHEPEFRNNILKLYIYTIYHRS